MWNKKEISQLDAMLTRAPLTLTLDLDLWPWIFKVKLYLRNGRPNCHGMKGWESIGCSDVKHYRNESTGCWADWSTFDLEFSRSNCISGMGGSIVVELKGQESLGCPDVKHNHYVTPRQRMLLMTGWLKMSAFPLTRLVSLWYSQNKHLIVCPWWQSGEFLVSSDLDP